MRVPNAETAEVPLRKVSNYLLNAAHPDAADKANFFLSRGFSPHRPLELVSTLLQHLRRNEVVNTRITRFGISYAVDGPCTMPDHTVARLRTVWFVDTGSTNPRLVTTYPTGAAATTS